MASTYTSSSSSSSSSGGSNSSTTSSSNSTTNSSTKSSTNGGSTSRTTGSNQSKTYSSGTVSANTQKNYDKYNNDYNQGDSVTSAYNKLQETLNNKPGAFNSSYQDQLNNLYGQITNGEAFSFDPTQNVIYQQLKDQYTAKGNLNMQDAMGQAAANTGGMASSYAQTAGQNAYNETLEQLNEEIPDLYSMELSKYQNEREDLYNQFDATKGLSDTEYDQYRDRVSDWQTDRAFYESMYQNERDFDYNQYAAERSYWEAEYWAEKDAEKQTNGTSNSNTNGTSWSNTSSNTTSNTSSNSTSNTSSNTWQNTSSNSSSESA